MEVLFRTDPKAYAQAATNLAAREKKLEDKFACKILADIKKVTRKEFILRDVEDLNSAIGSQSGVEAYNKHIFVDTQALVKKEVTPGKFRQWLMFGASHQGYGGKRWYDTASMNCSIAASFVTGLLLNKWWPMRFSHIRYSKVLRFPACAVTFFAGIPFWKAVWSGFGLNIVWVNHHMRKAFEALDCEECLEEVKEASLEDIKESEGKVERESVMGQRIRTDLILVKRLLRSKRFDGHKCSYHDV